jgi:hypothetical protein
LNEQEFLHEATRRSTKKEWNIQRQKISILRESSCYFMENLFSRGSDFSRRISPFLQSRKSNPAHPSVEPDETRLAVLKNGMTAHQWAGDGISPEQAMDLTDALVPNGFDLYP